MNGDSSVSFKPKFVSKKERERKKKEEEKKAQEEKEKELKLIEKKNKLYERGLKGEKLYDRLNGNKSKRTNGSSSTRDEPKEKKRDEKLKDKLEDDTPITSKEIEMIKNTKLGINKEKRKLQKPSEKFKKIYVDDWNPEDDTSIDINPLYQQKYQPKILFGKGLLAGIDPSDQKGAKVSSHRLNFSILTLYNIGHKR